MRLLLIISAAVVFSGCNPEKHSSGTETPATPIKIETVVHVKDTVYIPVFDYSMKNNMIDEMNAIKDSLFIERYKIEMVRYYLKICQHRPSQTKFLVSWINRAIH